MHELLATRKRVIPPYPADAHRLPAMLRPCPVFDDLFSFHQRKSDSLRSNVCAPSAKNPSRKRSRFWDRAEKEEKKRRKEPIVP